jgi:hypothetical protein
MSALQCALTLLSDCGRVLYVQISTGLAVPLYDQSADRPTRRMVLCNEIPGRLCRNGYGSLEVGGRPDQVND